MFDLEKYYVNKFHAFWHVAMLLCITTLVFSGTALAMDASENPEPETTLKEFTNPDANTLNLRPANQEFDRVTIQQTSNTGTPIALLVPLSGSDSAIGKHVLNAVQMALFDLQTERIRLLPFDTGSDEKAAKKAIEQAIHAGAHLSIGPITSDATLAVIEQANANNVTIISLSNSPALFGKGVFVFGFNPLDQIAAVIRYAMAKGITKYSALLPKNAYGNAVLSVAKETLSQQDLSFSHVSSYQGVDVTLSKTIDAVSGALSRNKYQALLVPEGGEMLLTLAKRINHKLKGAHPFVFLGSGQWDDPSLIKGSYLHGSFFASTSPDLRKGFETRYQENFGEPPPRIASLAYDALSLAAKMEEESRYEVFSNSSPFAYENFINDTGFTGVNGLFRFHPNGYVERSLSIIELTPNGFVEVQSAKESF